VDIAAVKADSAIKDIDTAPLIHLVHVAIISSVVVDTCIAAVKADSAIPDGDTAPMISSAVFW
jgi:hypothetical protein